jgi:hypothetical protein
MNHEQLADYWRERAELLQEWVCEFLKKNQALRMEEAPRYDEQLANQR